MYCMFDLKMNELVARVETDTRTSRPDYRNPRACAQRLNTLGRVSYCLKISRFYGNPQLVKLSICVHR